MPPQKMNASQARAVHIPAQAQMAMEKHMQTSMPANLKYYQQSGVYVPPHIQQAMEKHMQSAMPEHLKQYVSPYMQQKVVPQHFGATPLNSASNVSPQIATSVATHELSNSFQSQQLPNNVLPEQPQASVPEQNVTPQEPYGFITNPENKTKSKQTFLANKSLPIRIGIIAGGLVGLLLLVVLFEGVFGGAPKLAPFITVAQDQEEILHLTKNAAEPQTGQALLPTSYGGFLATSQLTVSSSNSLLLKYLATNKQKVTVKVLSVKLNANVDAQLTASAATGGYTALFQSTMTDALTTYQTDIKSAYINTSGVKGRALLKSDYDQATLLQLQLNQASTSAGN